MSRRARKTLRDFYYVDDQLVQIYFTQLPRTVREQFHQDYGSTAELGLKASWPPSIETKRTKLEAPYSTVIAQLMYVEDQLKASEQVGSLETPRGRFIEGVFSVRYASVRSESGGIFFVYAAEGSSARKAKYGKSFTILGDLSKCWFALGRPPERTPDESTLRRLVGIYDGIRTSKQINASGGNMRPHYGGFSDGKEGVLKALKFMELYVRDSAVDGTFHGLLIIRDKFVDDTAEHYVLYPIYLERTPATA